jgi:MFS family permease
MASPTKSDQKWLWIFVPINAAMGGFSTLLPLYVIDIGGTVIDVGAIVSAYSLALIPSSILWGLAIDKKEKRKPFITYSYLGITVLLGAGFFLADIATLLLLYVCYAAISTAASPAVSVLLIESSQKKKLSMTFAKYSSLTLLGTALGTIPGTFWTVYLPLRAYFLLCAIFSGISVVVAARYLPEPELPLERKVVALTQDSFVTKLRTVTMIFITIPSLEDIRSFWRMMRNVFARYLPLLYLSFFLFYTALNLFFTSYTPFLKSRQMDDTGVFMIFSTLYILQAAVYPITARACNRYGEDRVAVSAVWLRIAGFLAALTTVVFMFRNSTLTMTSMMSIAMIGTAFAFYNTSSSVLLFRSLAAGKQGELLGIYSALTGIAAFVGAIISGYLSYHFGYSVTFVTAVLLLVGCALSLRSAVTEHYPSS